MLLDFFLENMVARCVEQIQRNRTGLSLLNSAFDVMVVTSLSSLGQGESRSGFFQTLTANYTMNKNLNRIVL